MFKPTFLTFLSLCRAPHVKNCIRLSKVGEGNVENLKFTQLGQEMLWRKAPHWNIHLTCCCSFNNFNSSLKFDQIFPYPAPALHSTLIKWEICHHGPLPNGRHEFSQTEGKCWRPAKVIAWVSAIIRLQIVPNTSNILHNEIALVNQWANKKLRSNIMISITTAVCFFLTFKISFFVCSLILIGIIIFSLSNSCPNLCGCHVLVS